MNRGTNAERTSPFNVFRSSFRDWSPVLWLCLSAAICVALFITALSIGSANRDSQQTVVNVYCASAVVEPMRKIIDQFNSSDFARSESIVAEITRAGGSGALAGQLSAEAQTGVLHMADIFVCADSNRMSNLVSEEVIAETFPIVTQFPVIAIRDQANSDLLQVSDLPSLLELDIKLGIGSATSAIGFETRLLAKSNHCLDLLQARKTADFENVMSLAQALSIGSVDAAILWDSTVHQFNRTENQNIKILTYLSSDKLEPEQIASNPKENAASSKQNFSTNHSFGKFSNEEGVNSNRPGCFIEVGRSISTSHRADLFFSFLKNNRDEVLSIFVDTGFSTLPPESSLDNGRESNQP